MIAFPEHIIGCPLRDGHGLSVNPSTNRLAALKGRTRHELKDLNATYRLTLTFDMSTSQFASWQMFWTALNKGVDWWTIDTSLGADTEVHATGPFIAVQRPDQSWQVSLEVEALP